MQITQFMGAHIAQDHIVLASEFMACGDLWQALTKDTTRQFSWYQRCAFSTGWHASSYSYL